MLRSRQEMPPPRKAFSARGTERFSVAYLQRARTPMGYIPVAILRLSRKIIRFGRRGRCCLLMLNQVPLALKVYTTHAAGIAKCDTFLYSSKK